jgi:Cu2+-containing amine oxidase
MTKPIVTKKPIHQNENHHITQEETDSALFEHTLKNMNAFSNISHKLDAIIAGEISSSSELLKIGHHFKNVQSFLFFFLFEYLI